MSDAVKEFLSKVTNDPALKARYDGLSAKADVVAMGKELGFTFGEADLTAALGDEIDLDLVTGGVMPKGCLP